MQIKSVAVKNVKNTALLAQVLVCCLIYAPSAFALDAGQGTIQTVISWMQEIGIGICTIAIMWAAVKIMFQGARINDVAPTFIGGILFGSAAIIAGMFMSS